MTGSARARSRVAVAVLLASALGWAALLLWHDDMTSNAHCLAMELCGSSPPFRMLLAMNPLSNQAVGWAVMLVAMMAPTLVAPILHVRERSLRRRRARAVTMFAAGYAAIWMLAGGALLTGGTWLTAIAPQSYLPAIGVGLVAILWQCTPFKQRCLNRGHEHTELAAFGRAADRDALRFGLSHGVWCVASCWALMAFPMLLPRGHVVAMLAATIVMVSERLEHPSALGWRWRGPGKLLRIAFAQSAMRLRALTASGRVAGATASTSL